MHYTFNLLTSYQMTLTRISSQITIYYGVPVFFLGTIGAILNVLVFLTSKIFRENACIFYLTSMSVLNFGQLFIITFSNCLSWRLEIDWTIFSLIFCKLRAFTSTTCALCSMTCLCLAMVNQYFASRSHPRLRQWCTLRLAHRLTVIFFFIYTIHGILYLVYYGEMISPVTNKTICQITNPSFIQYHIYGYFLILSHLLPLIAMGFGLIAYHHFRCLTRCKVPFFRHDLGRQLTTMVLIQMLIYFLTFLPYSIQSIFVLITTNYDPIFQAEMNLASIITLHFSVLSYASPFYISLCVSKYFRQQLKYVLCDMKNFEGLQSIQLAVDEEAVDQRLKYNDEY